MKPNFERVPYPVFHASDFAPVRSTTARNGAASSASAPSASSSTRTLEHIAFSAREVHAWNGPTAVFFLNVEGLETNAGGGYAAHMAVRKSNAVRTIFEKGVDDVRVAGKCFGRGLLMVDVSGVAGGAIHGLNAPAAVFFNAAGEVVYVIPPGTDMTEAAILTGFTMAYEPRVLSDKLALGAQAIQVVKRNAGLRFQLDGKHAALQRAEEAARVTIRMEIDGLETEIARLDQVIAGFEVQLAPPSP